MTDVLILGGTWAPPGEAVTATFVKGLGPGFSPTWLPYAADYGRHASYKTSQELGWDVLLDAIHHAAAPVVVAGYSQGAAIAGNVVDNLYATGWQELREKVLATALIADPRRPAGAQVGSDPGGYGIQGQRPVQGGHTYWAAAPGDPITALDAGNPVRSIADLTEYWCAASPAALMQWGASVLATLARAGHTMQPWWKFWRPSDSAALAIWQFLHGRHTDAYVKEGHAFRLGEVVRQAVTP